MTDEEPELRVAEELSWDRVDNETITASVYDGFVTMINDRMDISY